MHNEVARAVVLESVLAERERQVELGNYTTQIIGGT